MTTDRLYLMAGSIAPRLNESLPASTTVLETDLDTDRDMVHVRVIVARNGVVSMGASGSEIYFGITETSITSEIADDNGFTSRPRKVFTVTEYMSDSTWAQTVADYITAEVAHFIACNRPTPTGSDYVKSQAESEQEGFSLA